jgi:hypothetical protein
MPRKSGTPPKLQPRGIRFPPDVDAALVKLAEMEDRQITWEVIQLVKEGLRARKLLK